jgi:hypothetical protein
MFICVNSSGTYTVKNRRAYYTRVSTYKYHGGSEHYMLVTDVMSIPCLVPEVHMYANVLSLFWDVVYMEDT